MGKKHVARPTKEALLKERENIEERITKGGEGVKVKKRFERGRVYIRSSYNNTMMSFTDENGNVLYWTSAGKLGFRGAKKGTPFAATKVGEAVSQAINKTGVREIKVFVNGIGQGRESALRALSHRGVNFVGIKDITPIPHNGCRPHGVRRV